MADPRVVQLADILIHHSLRVQPGDKVLIAGYAAAEPLIRETYRKVLQAGGIPITQVNLPELERIYFEESNERQLTYTEHLDWLYHHVDCYLRILGGDNPKELTGVEGAKQSARSRARAPLSQYLMSGKVRWVLTMFPTMTHAQEADMSLEEYEDFVYGAVIADYEKMEREMRGIADLFDAGSEVRIVGKETDLTVNIEGRKAVLCHGRRNVPDGEFYYTPNLGLTEGHIYYEWPTLYQGKEVSGIRLTFREGRIVDYSAEKGGDALEQALNTDEGSRSLGELGIGVNFGIAGPTKNILFDEKIGGSVHLAVGRAYEAGGPGGNVSAIHWDMVKSLKDGGELYLDGKLMQRNGVWLIGS